MYNTLYTYIVSNVNIRYHGNNTINSFRRRPSKIHKKRITQRMIRMHNNSNLLFTEEYKVPITYIHTLYTHTTIYIPSTYNTHTLVLLITRLSNSSVLFITLSLSLSSYKYLIITQHRVNAPRGATLIDCIISARY